MIGIIGRKLGMTQIFNENGEQVPCTVIAAEPNPVLAVTDKAKAGFASVQLGFERQRSAREDAQNGRTPRGRPWDKAEVGHAKKAGLDYAPRVLHRFRLDEPGNAKIDRPRYNVGDAVKVEESRWCETTKML